MALSTMLTGPCSSLSTLPNGLRVRRSARLLVACGPVRAFQNEKRARSSGIDDLGEVFAEQGSCAVTEERLDALVQVAEATVGIKG
jgi:hypothetical protein